MIEINYTRPPLYNYQTTHSSNINKKFNITIDIGIKSGIYCIKNILDGKVYIGSGQDLNARRTKHINDLLNGKSHNLHLQAAFNKQGKQGFVFGILEYCDVVSLEARESFWIMELQSNNPEYGYNKRVYCSSNRGYKQTDKMKQLTSERMKNRVISEET